MYVHICQILFIYLCDYLGEELIWGRRVRGSPHASQMTIVGLAFSLIA